MRRLRRWLASVAFGIALLVATLAWLDSPAGHAFVHARLSTVLGAALGGDVRFRVDAVQGLRRLVLGDVAVRTPAWRVAIPRVVFDLAPRQWLGGEWRFPRLVLEAPVFRLARIRRGADASAVAIPEVVLERIIVRDGRATFGPGTLQARPVAVADVTFDGSLRLGRSTVLDVAVLDARPRGLAWPRATLHGRVRLDAAGRLVVSTAARIARGGTVAVRGVAEMAAESLAWSGRATWSDIRPKGVFPVLPAVVTGGQVRGQGRGSAWDLHGRTRVVLPRGVVAGVSGSSRQRWALHRDAGVDVTPRGRMTAELDRLIVADRPIDRGRAHVRLEGAQLVVTGLTLRTGGVGLDATGSIATTTGAIDGTVVATSGLPWPGQLRGTARVRTHERGIVADVEALTVPDPTGVPWRLVEPFRVTVDGGIVATPAVLANAAQRVRLQGHRDASGRGEATLVLSGVHLAGVCRAAGLTVGCQGAAEGTGRALLAPDGVTFESRWQLAAGTVAVTGWIPSEAGARGLSPRWRVSSDHLDPALLPIAMPDALRDVAGAASLDLSSDGRRRTGSLRVRGGRFSIPETGARFSDVELRGSLSGDVVTLTLDRAAARAGTVTGVGRVDLSSTPTIEGRLVVSGTRLIDQPGMQALADGALDLDGTVATPRVRGAITLREVVVRPARLPLAQRVPELDPTIEVVGGPTPAPQAVAVALADVVPPGPLAVDIDVRVAPGARVVRPDAMAEFDGLVHVRKAPHATPRVGGTLWLRGGWIVFQGKRFWLDGGAVSLLEQDPPDAWVDVWAKHQAGEYEVRVGLVGPVRKPDLRLLAVPALPEADVLAVLLFGRPTGALASSESSGLRRQAVGLASDYAAPGLRSSIMDVFGLEVFDVEVPTGGTDVPGEVRIGRYVGDSVFVTLAQEFGAGVAQVVGAEYVLGRGISVRISASSRGRGAVDVLWSRRY